MVHNLNKGISLLIHLEAVIFWSLLTVMCKCNIHLDATAFKFVEWSRTVTCIHYIILWLSGELPKILRNDRAWTNSCHKKTQKQNKPTKKPQKTPQKSWKWTDSGWVAQIYLNAFYAERKLDYPLLLEFILFWTHWLLRNNEEGRPVLYKNKQTNIKAGHLPGGKSW